MTSSLPQGPRRVWEKKEVGKGWWGLIPGVHSWSRVDFVFFFFQRGWGWFCSHCDSGMWESCMARNCWRNLLLIVFVHWIGLASLTTHVLSHCLFLFFPFIALMVLNNLYVSECTAPSVHVRRVRWQLGQSGRITWFYPSLKAAGQLTFSCTLYSPQTDRVGFLKRSKASGAIKAPQRASFRSLCCTVSWRNVPEWIIAMLF